MSDELERLRADLEVLKKYRDRYGNFGCAVDEVAAIIREKEAAADQWREAKEAILLHLASGGHKVKIVAQYSQHLTAELAAKERRIAELEAEIKAEDEADVADAENALMRAEFVPFEDMQPPFEGPIVGIEPILDPARVLATAEIELRRRGCRNAASIVQTAIREEFSIAPEPYKLKEADK